jgi:cysteinyl-tRNA synthetase
MGLRVYNTLTGDKEEFQPVNEGQVKIYSCGPTVYDYFHIGNARAFIVPDIIKRYLEYQGYDVYHVLNFTDIDDKMINRANKEEITTDELADKFIEAYFTDTDKLNIKRADAYPKATDCIKEMIKLVQDLLDKGYAYEKDGDVYFRVEEFEDYGKLSNKKLEDLQAGARVEVNEAKENPLDFVLWKQSKPGEPSWDSPWGEGRPGWHIECSVMSVDQLGEKFDIHTGGIDLVFPHHENEIAQSEAYCEEQVINYWLHNGYLNIDGEKMSKSEGNFFTTREILTRYPAEAVRFFLISKHYRSPINFSDENLTEAHKGLKRLRNTVSKLEHLIEQPETKAQFTARKLRQLRQEKKKKFITAMNDDFNTAQALGALHELAGETNKFINQTNFKLTREVKNDIIKLKETFVELGKEVLGLTLTSNGDNETGGKETQLIELLLKIRQKSREEENYQLADEIRDKLEQLGVEVEDTPQGAKWELVKE